MALVLSIETDEPTLTMGNTGFTPWVKCNVGDTLTIEMVEKGGYKEIMEMMNLVMSDDRSNYLTDEIFANFRMVNAGNIKDSVLFRTSSPFNNEENKNRYLYSDELCKAAGIKTIDNLAESADDIESMVANNSPSGPYCYQLMQDGHLLAEKMGINFYIKSNAEVFADHIRHIIDNDPPYLVHCRRGKDRTGLFCLMLEVITDAPLYMLEDDFMESFINLYNIEKDSNRYDIVKQKIFDQLLYFLAYGYNIDIFNLDDIDPEAIYPLLKPAILTFLTETAGLTQVEINHLIDILTE